MKFKALIPMIIIVAGFAAVGLILWDQEFKYYVAIDDHTQLEMDSKIALEFLPKAKPAYIHFFSEDCRQARINLTHVNQIVTRYSEEVDFFIVNTSTIDPKILKKKYDLHPNIRVINDSKRKITHRLHVASTPYAVISTADQHLFFGGNYNNKNGLCGAGDIIWSSPAVALRALMKKQLLPLFPNYQLDFRGCGT